MLENFVHNLIYSTYKFIDSWGLWALFLFSITESIVNPVPPDVFLPFAASKFGVLKVTFAALAGNLIGAIISYVAFYYFKDHFSSMLLRNKYYLRARQLLEKWEVTAVIVAALTPIPYKLMCWSAGFLELNFVKFIVASILARGLRFFVVASVGRWSLEAFMTILKEG